MLLLNSPGLLGPPSAALQVHFPSLFLLRHTAVAQSLQWQFAGSPDPGNPVHLPGPPPRAQSPCMWLLPMGSFARGQLLGIQGFISLPDSALAPEDRGLPVFLSLPPTTQVCSSNCLAKRDF